MSVPHSPGPWWIKRGLDCNTVAVLDARRHYVVEDIRPDADDDPTQEREANARLIAAAPDLLKALKLVDLYFQRNHISGNFQGDDEHEAWSAASTAIEKAEAPGLPNLLAQLRASLEAEEQP